MKEDSQAGEPRVRGERERWGETEMRGREAERKKQNTLGENMGRNPGNDKNTEMRREVEK